MDLSYDELDKCLTKIFTGQEMVSINDGIKNVCVVFKQPDNSIKAHASFLYDESYTNAIKDGLLSKTDLENLIEERNLFTEADQLSLDKLDSKLKGQEFLLSKTTKVKAKSDRIKKVIAEIKREKQELLSKKTSKLSMSAEMKATEDKNLYLCWNCAYLYKDGSLSRLWDSYKDLMTDKNHEFRSKVLSDFLDFYGGMSHELIRYIARSNLWRIRYVNAMKASDSLFGVPTSEYTSDMLNLVYWSNFYQNIYEMMPKDRPSDDVIEDDDRLDEFMKEYYEEVKRESANARYNGGRKLGGKLDALNSQEVIITRSNEMYEEIEYDKPIQAQMSKGATDFKVKSKKAQRRDRKAARNKK